MRFGIAAKVNLLSVLLIVFVSSWLGFSFYRHESKALSSELNERTYVLLNSMSVNSEYPILIRDREALARLVRGVLAQKDVVHCRVEDKDGALIYQEGKDPESAAAAMQYGIDVTVKSPGEGPDDEAVILGASLLQREKIGRILLTISRSRLREKQRDVVKTVLGVVIIAVILASVASYLLFKVVLSNPIAQLLGGTERIAKGDLNYRVPATGSDDIGRLATAFNQMVHDLKISRDELQAYSHNLEERVRERTRDLQDAYDRLRTAEEQLIQSAKMASLGTLAGGVAHEINNPLTGVLGYAQLLLATMGGDDPHRTDIEEIEKSAVRCKTIIDNLLRFSRQQKFSFDLIDVNRVVDDTVVLIGNQLHRNNIRITKRFAGDIPTIRGNAPQLQQVFLNIIINAFDAMPDGGDLDIVTRTRDAVVEIEFSDTGCGIPGDVIGKVFEPFVTTKPPGKGTGLGLSVSYGIVQKHGGQIAVRSREGEGTMFTVTLPVNGGPVQ